MINLSDNTGGGQDERIVNLEAEIERLRSDLKNMTDMARNAVKVGANEIRAQRTISPDLHSALVKQQVEIERLRNALRDMIQISFRNSEATRMLIAIRKCAEHALEVRDE